MRLAVGLDIGGTKIAGAVVDVASGSILRAARASTPSTAADVLEGCRRLVRGLDGVGLPLGVSVCELVDHQGRPVGGQTVHLEAVDIADELRDLGPVRLESDVRAAALAEARFGGAIGEAVALIVSVGTGISCCLVLDGRPMLGAHGHAILLGAPQVEGLAGGAAMARRAREAGLDPLAGSPEMEAIRAEAGVSLGATVAVLVNALDPSVVVYTGGLTAATTFITAAIHETLRAAEPIPGVARRAITSPLGGDAAVIGAALVGAGTGGHGLRKSA